MEKIIKFTYEEMCKQLNRNELIIIDTNSWLELYKLSFTDIKEIGGLLGRNFFMHEIFVTPHICEEYLNGIKKIKNTYNKNQIRKSQLLDVYKKMNDSINTFDDSFNNYVGYGKIVEKTNKFYKSICKKIELIQFDDVSDFDVKEKFINSIINYCKDNYNKLPKVKNAILFKDNIWKSDSKKLKNKNGDLIIWNEILNLAVNYKADKLILIEEEKKNEWTDKRLVDSLLLNTKMDYITLTMKEFLAYNMRDISYDLYCKCVNYYDRFYQFTNINNLGKLCNNYKEIMKKFKLMDDVGICNELKEHIITDFVTMNLSKDIRLENCKILKVESLDRHTYVNTSSYDEIKINHLFQQKFECVITIVIGNEYEDIRIKDSFVNYQLISDRLLNERLKCNVYKKTAEEWIEKNVVYDYIDLKEKIINIICDYINNGGI